ncbi:MAG: flavin reductase family protein [Nanoarchaeota archaeon]|nr:flavin reductase family protein [Nanoarchaeota archaeon]
MKKVNIKETLKKFKPQIVTFILSTNKNGNPSGMVADWTTQVSHDPPLLLITIKKTSNTYKLVKESKEFVLAVANKELEEPIKIFSSKNTDKFKESGIKTFKSKKTNIPLLSDASMNFICKVENEIEAGDHILFIGKVIEAYQDENKKILINLGRGKENLRIFKEF